MHGVIGAGVVDYRQIQTTVDRYRYRLNDLWDNMLRGHEIDIMTSSLLKMNHDTGKLLRCIQLPISLPRDVKVLAEDTFQIAEGKEDGSGPPPTPQTILFTEMWKRARDVRKTARSAHRGPILKPIYVTVTRTDLAASKHFEGTLHLLLKKMTVCLVGKQV
jgi:hypothetical protein